MIKAQIRTATYRGNAHCAVYIVPYCELFRQPYHTKIAAVRTVLPLLFKILFTKRLQSSSPDCIFLFVLLYKTHEDCSCLCSNSSALRIQRIIANAMDNRKGILPFFPTTLRCGNGCSGRCRNRRLVDIGGNRLKQHRICCGVCLFSMQTAQNDRPTCSRRKIQTTDKKMQRV